MKYNQEPYEKLQFYQNLIEIRKFVYRVTKRFERSNPRLTSQMRAAIRSAKQNTVEGYKKDSIGHFINFMKIVIGSLAELIEDFKDCALEKLISNQEAKYIIPFSQKTEYMIKRYLDSLIKMQRQGTWKQRWKQKKSR